jgi:hypothetical protein
VGVVVVKYVLAAPAFAKFAPPDLEFWKVLDV